MIDFDFDYDSIKEKKEDGENFFQKPKLKVSSTVSKSKVFTVEELEDYFVESYVQDYFESKNNSIFKRFLRETYSTIIDLSTFINQIKSEVHKNKNIVNKEWYKKYKS